MSDYAERLEALCKAKYPDLSEDMDMYDITDGITWMADRIEELEVKLSESEALLAKAVGVLSDLADCVDDGCFCSEVRMAAVMDYAYITIAEIKGDKI